MKISSIAYNRSNVAVRGYLRISVSVLIAVVLMLSSVKAESASRVRKRLLGIGFASKPDTRISNGENDPPIVAPNSDISISNDYNEPIAASPGSTASISNDDSDPPTASPESNSSVSNDDRDLPSTSPYSNTSISNDDSNPPTASTEKADGNVNDNTNATIIPSGVIIDEASITPASTKKAEKSAKAKFMKSSVNSKLKEKSKLSRKKKVMKVPSKIDGSERKLGIGSSSPGSDPNTRNCDEDVPIASNSMVEDATESTISKKMGHAQSKASKSSKKKASKSSSTNASEALGNEKLTNAFESEKTKVPTEVDNVGRFDDGGIEFGFTEEPTSSSTSTSSLYTSSLIPSTFDPTLSSTGPPTESPAPTSTPSTPKASKNSKAAEGSKKNKGTQS